MALTDHDSTGGIERFLKAGEEHGMQTISGVEISAEYSPGTMHMLGYFVDHAHEHLNERLRWIRDGREGRNHEILKKLNDLGCEITWEEVTSYAGEDVVGRPHFAQALLARGYVTDKDDAFKKYLAKGKPAYADRRRLSPADCVAVISEAGGVAVLAHPFTLRVDSDALRKLVEELAAVGLQGLEAYYSEHSREKFQEYVKLCEEFGLIITGGTDFHGEMTPDIEMGSGFGSMNVPDEIADKLRARWEQIRG